jgi:cytochrome c biogenesis protein
MNEKRVVLKAFNFLKRVWHFLARMDLASILILAVLLLAVLGSCFPQLSPSIAASSESQARRESSLESRYGPWTGWLSAMGLFQLFSSPVFVLCVSLLIAASLVCTLNRWRATWRRAFHQEVCCPDATFETSEFVAHLISPTASISTSRLSQVTRKSLEGRGFRIKSEEAGETLYLRADRNRLALLGTLVSHLGVLLLLLGSTLTGLYAWRETLTLGAGMPASLSRLSGVTLSYEGFNIERYPDGSAKDYVAQVLLAQPGKQGQTGTIRVNEPMSDAGFQLYLNGFERTSAGDTITLLAVHDPGYCLVILAGFLLLLGIVVSLYLPHCCIFARLEPGGILHLAGRAERQACDFDGEFTRLVAEIEQSMAEPPEAGGLAQ